MLLKQQWKESNSDWGLEYKVESLNAALAATERIAGAWSGVVHQWSNTCLNAALAATERIYLKGSNCLRL